MESLVTTETAARLAGLSKWFLYKHSHEIPAAHQAGRALRWDVAALKKWMRDQAVAKANGSDKNG